MSNQISQEEIQRRAGLLKRAKQILIQEYAAVRTQQHQQWIRDSETSWRTNGVLMAYPPSKLYPTEQEIVDKALELYNKSIIPTTPDIQLQDEVATIFNNAPTTDDSTDTQPTSDLSANVTEQLQSAYKKGPVIPNIVGEILTTSTDKYIESLTQPIEQPTQDTQPIDNSSVDETTNDTPVIDNTDNNTDAVDDPSIEVSVTPKHSLLRSVLSGWLSKNKDKET